MKVLMPAVPNMSRNMTDAGRQASRSTMRVHSGRDGSTPGSAEAAASLLDAGFAAPQGGNVTLASLQPYGDTATPTSMRDDLCRKKSKAELSEAAEAPKADKPKSPYQIKLVNPVEVAVGLGGATGPVPKALADLGGNDFADVPVPGWRPDVPPPPGFGPVASGAAAAVDPQGDGTAKSAN